ncbi:AAA domain-containing protein, partial [Pirellulales bacterium]|nr:AAA domain-containing protein [Pirellulales bacterium]
KKKGIRDKFYLEISSTDAEINPVVRYQFKQLYDIDLPSSIDLTTSNLDEVREDLARQIAASEPGVELEKIDRPRVALIYDKARRRLDQYRRRARVSGRGVRKFLDLDYSYDPANFHPLGIKLFSAKVRPSATHLREIIEEQPRPRSFASAPGDVPSVEKERQFYEIQEGGEANPYQWTFDLCNVTLASFQYRKMSLVRDYETLLGDSIESPSFDRLFSLSPRPATTEEPPLRPFRHRHDVVPCDPTQARAIARSESGESYIIQGPPGTGKSQTITNLIADFAARGQRVLFVCEKRAAIDVVYARLRQCGLAELCCLIHDSQTDKKALVMDLKETYERFLAPTDDDDISERRDKLAEAIRDETAPLEQFCKAMQSTPSEAGISIRELIDRCIELKNDVPPLDAVAREALPSYAAWNADRKALEQFADALHEAGGGTVWANHPLRILSPRLAKLERPLELVARCANDAGAGIDEAEASLSQSNLPRDRWEQWSDAILLTLYARRVEPIAKARQLGILNPASDLARWFEESQQALAKTDRAIAAAAAKNTNWREKLSSVDTALALEHARSLERTKLPWLRPAWWRVRRVLQQSYDFSAHQIAPPWSLILQELDAEHEVRYERQTQLVAMADRLDVSVDGIETLTGAIDELAAWLPAQAEWLGELHADLILDPAGSDKLAALIRAATPLGRANQRLAEISDDVGRFSLTDLGHSLKSIRGDLDAAAAVIACLGELTVARPETVAALRCHPYSLPAIEAAVAHQTLAATYQQQRHVDRFSGEVRRRHAERLEVHYDQSLRLNAEAVRNRVRQQFLEHLHIAEKPAAKLTI